VAAAAGDLATLKEEAARNPDVINQADENGWKPIHEVSPFALNALVCVWRHGHLLRMMLFRVAETGDCRLFSTGEDSVMRSS
jgi:hypothetical protein